MYISNSSRLLISAIAGLSVYALPSTNLFAQGTLEEIVVTAQKREESLQDVPITMQAFTGDQLNSLGVQKASDITKLAPNLSISAQNGIGHQIVMRGVGTYDFFGNAPGSVGMYMDEVTMSAPFLGGLGLYDMERVEVLRGPQNSLFGRNTTGGAINYISRAPEVGGEMEGYLRGVYGSYDRMEVEGAVSVPLGDTAALRIAGKTYNRDGVWNNLDTGSDYGDDERYSWRTTLRWEPTDSTTVTANFHSARQDSDSPPALAVGSIDSNFGAVLTAFDIAPQIGEVGFEQSDNRVNVQGLNPSTENWEDIYKTGANKNEVEVDGLFLKLQHEFDNISFTGIVSYDETSTLYTEDDGSSGNLRGGPANRTLVIDMDQEYEQASVELRLASTGDGPFRWIAGLYYFTEDSTLSQNISFGSNGTPAFNPFLVDPAFFTGLSLGIDDLPNGWPPGMSVAAFSVAELGNEVWSPYGHFEYDLRDDLTFTIGLRYTDDHKENPDYLNGVLNITGMDPATFYSRTMVQQMAGALTDCPTIDFVTVLPFLGAPCVSLQTTRDDLDFQEWGGKVGMDWQMTNDMMLYASYSRGFKSGKFDIEFLHTDVTPFPQDPVDVETLDAYEIGFKSSLLGGSMELNGALFYSVWKDQQVFNVGPSGPEFVNLPESEIMGLELEMKWAPTPTLMVQGGLGLMDSEITDATGITEAEQGHELPHTPGITFNGLVIQDIPMGDNNLALQADFQYVGESKVIMKNTTGTDEYVSRFLLNARATYSIGGAEKYQISVFGDNLTEDRYCIEEVNLAALSGTYYCTPNDGQRLFGVEARVNF